MKYLFIPFLLVSLYSCGSGDQSEVGDKEPQPDNEIYETGDTYRSFLTNLGDYCGKSFAGYSVYPEDEDHDFYGKPLMMTISVCEENRVLIPLQVGENKSRTWMLSLVDEQLSLKHDHRNEDGSPEDLTMYGGFATKEGSEWSQFFPADEETAKMLPEASTNVWNMVIHPDEGKFEYILHRHGNLRFHAIFDLSKPVGTVGEN